MDFFTILYIVGGGILLGGIFRLAVSHKGNYTSVGNAVHDLPPLHYSPDQSGMSAWWNRLSAEARAGNLEALTRETLALSGLTQAQMAALTAEFDKLNLPAALVLRAQEGLAEYEARIAEINNRRTVSEQASRLGVSVPVWEQVAVLKAQQQVDFDSRMQELALALEQARGLKEIDADFERQMAQLKREMVRAKHLMDYEVLDTLHERLSTLNHKLSDLRKSTTAPSDVKRSELNRMKAQIESLREAIRERSGGLV